MRYYNIKIDGAPSVFPGVYDGGAQWGTTLNGVHDPNAQQIEFQIIAWDAQATDENSVLTIHGVSWDQIKACNQLVGKQITINGGMSAPGLPLAVFQSQRPKLLIQGKINKCWGNWIGNDTSIGMSFLPTGAFTASIGGNEPGAASAPGSGAEAGALAGGVAPVNVNRTGLRSIDRRGFATGRVSVDNRAFSPLGIDPSSLLQQIGGQFLSESDIGPAISQLGNVISSFFGGGNINPLSAPLNIIHNMLPNVPLSSAIQETLSRVFPQANLNIAISSALKLAYQDAGIYQSIEQYVGYINNISQSILGHKAYQGIHLSTIDNTLDVWDGSSKIGDATIDYKDLVGQPTWIEFNVVSIKIVLRGGFRIGYDLTLPDTVVNFSGAGAFVPLMMSDQRSHISLPGTYKIKRILHIGDFRNPDGANWTTNLDAWTMGSVSGVQEPAPVPPLTTTPAQPGQGTITIRPIPGP
jgi:hypothetical protein